MNKIQYGKSVYKADKLLKVSLAFSGDIIQKVNICGDFFLYPEESITGLEELLAGTPLESGAIEAKTAGFFSQNTAYGFDAKSLAEAILLARQNSEAQQH